MLRWVARVALVVILSMCVAGSAMAAGEPWRDASQPPGQRADELLAAMTPDQKVAMALGDFASLAEPRRPHPALRRRAQRHPRRRHDVAAVGADAGGDLRPRPGPRLRRDDRRRGARQGLQLVAGAGDGHRAHAAGGAPAREPRRGPVPGGRDGGPGGRRRQEPPRDRDAQALRRQQRRVGPHRLQHPDRAPGQRERPRLRARAAGDLRGAVQARDPRVHGRRGDVLLQPPQRAADVRELGAALRPQGLGLRRLRGPRLHLRRQGPARRDARRASTSPRSAGRAGARPPCSPRARCRPRGWTTSSGARCSRCSTRAPSTTRSGRRPPTSARPSTRRWRRRCRRAAWCCCKNERHALPLGGRGLRSIAVIGPSGDDAVYISGGSSAVTPAPGATITPLAGIRARAGSGVERHRGAGLAGRRAADDDRARRRAPGSRRRTGTTATSRARPR